MSVLLRVLLFLVLGFVWGFFGFFIVMVWVSRGSDPLLGNLAITGVCALVIGAATYVLRQAYLYLD